MNHSLWQCAEAVKHNFSIFMSFVRIVSNLIVSIEVWGSNKNLILIYWMNLLGRPKKVGY
jgi:hypothetical protein